MKIKKSMMLNLVFAFVIAAVVFGAKSFMIEDSNEAEDYGFIQLENNNEISALFADDPYMYVGTREGVKVYNTDTLEVEHTIDDISFVYTASIIKASDGTIFMGHDNGMISVAADGTRCDYTYPLLPKGRVNAIAVIGDEVWCGTYNGLAILHKTTGGWTVNRTMCKADGLISDSVNVIYPTDNGALIGSYLDTEGGLTVIENEKVTTFGIEEGLVHPYVTSICRYDDTTYWLGAGYMRDGGITEISLKNGTFSFVRNYAKDDGIPGEKVRYLYRDGNYLWITTEYDGVLIASVCDDTRIYLKEENGLTDNEVKCIAKTKEYYWLGGKYGITLIPIDFMGD